MKKIIKFISLCSSITLLLTLPVGCSNNSSDSSENNSTASISGTNAENSLEIQSHAPNERSFNTDTNFNAEKVFKNIRIDDVLLPSPCSLSDFDDEYSFGMSLFDGEDSDSGRLVGNIIHDGSKALSFDIYNIKTVDRSDNKKLAKAEFDIISQTQDDAMDSHTLLSVDGISVGDKVEDVESTLGFPESLSMDGNDPASYTYISSDDKTKKIKIDFSEGNVSSITIYYNVLGE